MPRSACAQVDGDQAEEPDGEEREGDGRDREHREQRGPPEGEQRLTGEQLHWAFRRRRFVDVAVVDQAAVAHLDGPVDRLAHQIEVVGRHDDHGAAGVDVAQQLEDAASGALVEVAGGLVGQEDGGVVDQRAGDRHPLLLAARQLARIRPALGRQAHLGQHAHDPGRDGVGAGAGHLEREGDVLLGGAVFQQPEVLEHDAQPAAEPGHLVGAERS